MLPKTVMQKCRSSVGLPAVISLALLTLAMFCWDNAIQYTGGVFTKQKLSNANRPELGGKDEPYQAVDVDLNILYPVLTKVPQNIHVLYNRVPKCGSTSMMWAINKQSLNKGFKVATPFGPNMTKFFPVEGQKHLAEAISKLPSFFIYIRHLHFLEFQRFGFRQPLYINIIRDPVQRFISKFYYQRFGFAKNKGTTGLAVKRAKATLTENERFQTLDECLLNSTKCFQGYCNILAFFCGQEKVCRKLSQSALDRAKINLAQHFVVVGILEDMGSTLKVFEALLPRYFEGIGSVYSRSPAIEGSKTMNRKEPSAQSKEIIRRELFYEMQFYDFVKKRFYQQVDELKKLKLIV